MQHGRDTHYYKPFMSFFLIPSEDKNICEPFLFNQIFFTFLKKKLSQFHAFDLTLTLKPCNAGSQCMFDGTPSFRTVLTLLKRPMVREMQNMYVTMDIVLCTPAVSSPFQSLY